MKASKKFFLAFVVIALCILCDQLTKHWVQSFLRPGYVKPITSFLTLIYAWNSGISFGLFSCKAPFVRILLIACISLFIGILMGWYWNAKSFIQRISLIVIIGGALSNVYDRIVHRAVFDFIHFHWHKWYFPAFNIADMLITIGFLLLLSDNFQWKGKKF
jgi:signal peptidase II